MPIVMSQKLHTSDYDDQVGSLYHFPHIYQSYVLPSEWFVYYHPSEDSVDPERYYFGAGRIGSVWPDATQPDHFYAEIIDYAAFPKNVDFKNNGKYLEERTGVGTQFFRSARPLSQSAFDRIVNLAGLSSTFTQVKRETPDSTAIDKILTDLNSRYQNAIPRVTDEIQRRIDRPTAIGRALKEKLGYDCQVCGVAGFQTKAGGRYAEAHHLAELHRLIPGSLVTDNVLIVCANCHRKLHHADVSIRPIGNEELDITINGLSCRVRRNVLN